VVCNTMRGLVRLGHDVSLIALNSKKANPTEGMPEGLKKRIKYTVLDIDTAVSVLDVAVNLFSKTSFNINRFYSQEVERQLVRNVLENDYDIIQFEGLMMSLYLTAIRKYTKAKLVYRTHNIENQVWKRLSQQKTDPFKKSYLKMHARRIKNYELEQLNKVDAITVFTEQDKSTMIGYGTKAPIEILPIGINLELYVKENINIIGAVFYFIEQGIFGWFLESVLGIKRNQ